ncbi:Acg family FMN-binding oxidoreductase [Dyadobacter frigoris]|uniref:Acg family FMN-binding oxidoreductase n=1 Tax=Dyadobacter frigoris TaxID=2576211 RepID=UPI001C6FF7EE|nr:hypothetical protein [Dyadobacter frigoris]
MEKILITRKQFISIAAGTLALAGITGYSVSDKSNYIRSESEADMGKTSLTADERAILYLASLAPSGHNTQPWFVNYIEPYHWIIGNDKNKWLPGVDPTQRETMLSIGAFLQNLEYAAGNLGYDCDFVLLAASSQEENVMEVRLVRSTVRVYDIEKIRQRRTVRSHYRNEVLKKEDIKFLIGNDEDNIHFIPNTSTQCQWLSEQTLEANRIQSYRDAAQKELSEWIRFSSIDAEKYLDGLTMAGMEIEGIFGWYLRNFYGKEDVMKKGFREQSIDKVSKQVAQSAGWILITSKDDSVASLLETGKRMERLFLNVREKNIALHPMTQVLEEASTNQILPGSVGLSQPVQFILRVGYLKNYPEPVSLRRPVERFLRV